MRPIQDYAIIGDCRSAALVSRDGSIDWLCWPQFDSPSIFAALLDESAGRFRIAPAVPCRTDRHYLDRTNVLQTTFRTETGSVRLTDLMPVASEEEKRRFLGPDHEILRVATCEEGEVELEMLFEPRPVYGGRTPRLRDGGALGTRGEWGSRLLLLRTDMPGGAPQDGRVRTSARLRAGESFHFSLTFADDWPGVFPPTRSMELAGHRPFGGMVERMGLWADVRRRGAGGGHSKRSRAQAARLCAFGCGRGGSHDVAARTDGWGPELGLPLLLMARRVADGGRAVRVGLHGGGRGVRELVAARHPLDPAGAAGSL
jgi:hypothetical protein